jgi:hypothetical protein
MKPSAIRAKVITLAARRTDNFWELGNALLMVRDGTGSRAISRRPSKWPVSPPQAYYSAKSWIICVHLLGTKSALKRRLTKTQGHRAGPKQAKSQGATRIGGGQQLHLETPNPRQGKTPPSEARRVVLYFAQDDYEVFVKAIVQNGGSEGSRGNLVDKELALMALIEKAALSK